MSTLKAVRGTRDLLPPETALWNRVEATTRAVFARYGFGEIRTPIFEDTQLFVRGVGEETDVVSKCGVTVLPDPSVSSPAHAGRQETFSDTFFLCTNACLPADANKNPTGSCTYKTQQQWYANGFSVFNQTLTYTCTSITPQ